ncbi:hypothetical protein PybrP1_012081 [[Pythium] brassicae (nom. inval.)]|nr:hypothetical protein PybrP1_012081 [[Pythium] brassicae (nom. inval.)]
MVALASFATSAQQAAADESNAPVQHAHVLARLDYKHLAANLDAAVANARKRMSDADPALVVALYHQQGQLRHQANVLRAERNANAKQLRVGGGGSDALAAEAVAALRLRGQELKREIAACEEELVAVQTRMEAEALKIPNDTHPDAPVGDESASRVVRVGGAKRAFNFAPKDHYDLATALQLIDTQTAAKVSGSKFVYLCNEGAMLELALVHWTLSTLRARGFTVLFPPDVAHYKMVEGCGFQPRGEATQIYSLADSDLCLTATSEITLAASKSNEILASAALPLKLAGFSHCFRTETGHGGRLSRGIYRIHQFSKVEMFAFAADMAQSHAFFDEMLALQTHMYDALGLHYHVVDMASGDLGAPAYRKFDVLAWMPGRAEYGEVSSLSMCTDYQARRLNIRHRARKEDATAFVHTLNGTACAVPRLLISILETYQQPDGSVVIPPVLRPYMGMQEVITRPRG